MVLLTYFIPLQNIYGNKSLLMSRFKEIFSWILSGILGFANKNAIEVFIIERLNIGL